MNEGVNRIRVIIHGTEYTLRGTESPEHMRGVAALVDDMMAEIATTSSFMDERKAAVLTALNFADEYQKMKLEFSRMQSELTTLKTEHEDLMALLDEQTGAETKE